MSILNLYSKRKKKSGAKFPTYLSTMTSHAPFVCRSCIPFGTPSAVHMPNTVTPEAYTRMLSVIFVENTGFSACPRG
jgi:hypothetical protein